MTTETSPASTSKKMLWTGYVMSTLPVLMLLMGGVMKVMQTDQVVKSFTEQGWPENIALILGIVELGCTIVYLIPRTAVLGAILLTGYFGGAIATTVRLGDPTFVLPLAFGVLIWGGLFMRDARIRALIPLRS